MSRIDAKKFPKRPEQIWNPEAPDQTVDNMKMLALAWASNGPEIIKKMKQK